MQRRKTNPSCPNLLSVGDMVGVMQRVLPYMTSKHMGTHTSKVSMTHMVGCALH
eukprot:m.362090 g.362090  ORF g.362090 m.362090 type:complete len:54 (-) comp20108_c0_seq1:267-428(-)